MKIEAFDNQRPAGKEIDEDAADVLKRFNGKTDINGLRELGVIVLSSGRKSDEKEQFFELCSDGGKTMLTTGNLTGSVVFKNGDDKTCRLDIKCRFSEEDSHQLFFKHMLECVFEIDFSDSAVATGENLLLLAVRFKMLLEKAAEAGLFKQYRTFKNNDLKFRGKLDINRHILLNGMTNAAIAYDLTKRTADNPLNLLILYAAEMIRKTFPRILDSSEECLSMLRRMKAEAPDFKSKSVDDILNDKENLSALRHPYFAPYFEELRAVATALLREDGVSLFNDDTPAAGIVIDIAWLWEEYLFSLMKKHGYIHAVYGEKNGIRSFQSGHMLYPDFRLPLNKDKEKSAVVLDAKYKKADTKREDIHQILAYMFLTGANAGGLIYPPATTEDADKKTINQHTSSNEKIFRNFRFAPLPVPMPEEAFQKWLKKQENAFEAYLKSMSSQIQT